MATLQDIGTYGFGFLAGTGANREDLLDLITNVDPWDTPWVTQAPKVRAQHVVHEWLTDTLAATSTAGAIEGDDWNLTAYTTTRPVRKLNYTQIFRKDIQVSETQRAVNPAGFKDAYAYEVQKATKEIARNLECRVFVTASTTGASGSSAAARTMFPLRAYMTTTATGAGQTVSGAGVATAGVLSVTTINNALERCYLNGGNPEQIWVSPTIKRMISGFSQNAGNRNVAAIDKKLINTVDFLMTDFGMMTIFMSRWIPQATNTATGTAASDLSGNIWILERAKNRLAWLRPVAHTLIGKRGDSVAGVCLGETTLEVLNERANFVITAVSNLTA